MRHLLFCRSNIKAKILNSKIWKPLVFNSLPALFVVFDYFSFQIRLFRKFLSEIPSECQHFGSRSGPKFTVGPDPGPNCLQMLLTGKALIIIIMLSLCMLVNHKCVLWQTVKTKMKCHIKYGISPGSTLFARSTTIFRESIQIYLEIIAGYPFNIQWIIPSLLYQTRLSIR